jgi:hypothetical protein
VGSWIGRYELGVWVGRYLVGSVGSCVDSWVRGWVGR